MSISEIIPEMFSKLPYFVAFRDYTLYHIAFIVSKITCFVQVVAMATCVKLCINQPLLENVDAILIYSIKLQDITFTCM